MTTMKQRLRAGEHLIGGLLRMPNEDLVEMAGVAGMDYLVVDCEHGPADLVPLRHHISAATAHGMDVLVRVGRDEPGLVMRVLDLGATGIIVPHVDTSREAEKAVRAVHYPPRGDRGFATYTRAGRFGSVTAGDHLRGGTERTFLVVMLESEQGCANAREIADVDGVDAVLVGPADLAVSMGRADAGGQQLQSMVDSVHQAVHEAGREVVTIVNSTRQAANAPRGLVVYNLAHVLLNTLRELRGAYPATPP